MSIIRFVGRIDDRTVKVQMDLLNIINDLVGTEPHTDPDGHCFYCHSSNPRADEHKSDCVWAEARRMLIWLHPQTQTDEQSANGEVPINGQ